MKKYSAIAFFTAVLVAMAFLVGKLNLKKSLPITLVVENEEGNEEISSWYNEREDVFYFFVPSYADAGKLRFNVKSSLEYICKQDGKAVDDEYPDRFSEGDYDFCVKNREYSVRIKCSENIATLYINTASGSMKSVTKDKSKKEDISVRLFNEEGKKDFESAELKLKGRGNSTWEDVEKKSFNVIANEPLSFWGLKPSSKWVLQANVYDSSNMRNKLVYDFAEKIGLGLAPKGDYVDLFINGEYYGLYFLCQSAETIDERCSFADEVILKLDLLERVKKSKCFLTEANEGLGFEIVFPQNIEPLVKETLIQDIDDLNAKIEESNGDWIKNFDLDSWSKKYLIDEVFSNFDAMIASSYFVVNQRNGKPYLSVNTVWDFDNSMGNERNYPGSTINPQALFARFEYRGNSSYDKRLWYSQLYDNELFYNEVVGKFQREGSDILEWVIYEDIAVINNKIKESADNDSIRWNYAVSYEDEVAYVSEYLKKRLRFLNSLWVEKRDYVVTTFEREKEGKQTYYFFVERGKTLLDDLMFENIIDYKKMAWVNKSTGVEFDIESPIKYDCTFIRRENNYKTLIEKYQENEDILFLICMVILVMISSFSLLKERK